MDRRNKTLWVSSILTFGVTDTITTYVGLNIVGLTEGNVVPGLLYDEVGFVGILLLKTVFFAYLYLTWSYTDDEYKEYHLYVITLFGIAVTCHNVLLIYNHW